MRVTSDMTPRSGVDNGHPRPHSGHMTTNNSAVDWVVALAWSLGHAILTALVGRTAVNAAVTYDTIRLDLGRRPAQRWVGRCKCRQAHKVDGVLARGIRASRAEDQIVVSGALCYRTAGDGANQTALFVNCACGQRARLERVFDSHKPNRPRHECDAKCMASTGPSCECKCKGANHGAAH